MLGPTRSKHNFLYPRNSFPGFTLNALTTAFGHICGTLSAGSSHQTPIALSREAPWAVLDFAALVDLQRLVDGDKVAFLDVRYIGTRQRMLSCCQARHRAKLRAIQPIKAFLTSEVALQFRGINVTCLATTGQNGNLSQAQCLGIVWAQLALWTTLGILISANWAPFT